jgi:predicted ATPase
MVETIVRICPHVSILATSRELLRIDGEYAYRVPPLDVPAENTLIPGDLLQHSAVQLFVARIQSLRPTYVLREDDIRAIAAICRKLDGIPLAIEFTAARAATLGISQILASLNDMFGALTGGRRTALPRHQTLRAALDWSYELLPAHEQRLLRYLAIFAGGFTLEAASAVIDDQGNAASTMDGVASLVEKSLISLDQLGADSRWRLLETTRTYALEKLKKEGGAETAARRHAIYFRDFVGQKPRAAAPAGNFAIYGKEVGNVRAALDWAFSPAGDVKIGATLAAAYAPVWFYLSSMGECGQQVERALSKLDGTSDETARLRMQLYIALGLVLAYTVAMEEKTQSILTKALEIADRLGDVESQLLTIWSLWNLRGKNGDHRESLRLAELFLEVSLRSSDAADALIGERLVGTALHFRGRQPDARRHLEMVLENYIAPTSERHSNFYLYDLRMVTRALQARVMVLQGFVRQAEACAQESLAISKNLNSNLSTCYALRYAVCSVALITGDLAQADESIAMLINFATKHNFGPFLKQGRYLEGMLLIKRGEFSTGTKILHTNLEANIRDGWSLCYPEALSVLAEGYAGLGNYPEAFRVLQQAFDWSDRQGERWCDPELFRVKGCLIHQDATRQERQKVEDSFTRAITIARHQGALFWELKAALSFARIKIQQDRLADAQKILAPVYARFTEGLDTADLRSAKEILVSSDRPT